jgi:CubicO group peptidase (beta-lactamase class C family)
MIKYRFFKKMIYLILIFTLFSRFSPADNLPAGSMDNYIKKAMSVFQVPGVAVGVIHNNEIVFERGYGFLQKNGDKRVDSNTSFAIASISKSFTSMALGFLVDEGKIKWEDQVIDYLPQFRMYEPWVTANLQIRDLLIHHTGLPAVSGGTIWYGSDYTPEQIIPKIRYIKPVSSFRSEYAYQNITFLVAGQIVSEITDTSWDQFIHKRVFFPVDMTRSTTSQKELRKLDNVATPHAIIDEKLTAIEYMSHDNIGPAASINSCVSDLLNYVKLILNQGKFDSRQVVSKETINKITSPEVSIPVTSTAKELQHMQNNFKAYGFGWFIKDYRGEKVVYHTGGVDGNRSIIIMLPRKKLGIVVLTNQEQWRIYNCIAYRIIDCLMDYPEFDYIKAYKNDLDIEKAEKQEKRKERLENRTPDTKPSLNLHQYCGTYRDKMYGDVFVLLKNRKLRLNFSHTPAFQAELEHWHYDTFKIIWDDPYIPDGLLTFKLDSKAGVERIDFNQPALLDVDFEELDLIKID